MSGTSFSKSEKNRKNKVFIRMSKEEFQSIKAHAELYTGGNVSKWMRERASKPMLDVSIKMQNEIDGGLFNEK